MTEVGVAGRGLAGRARGLAIGIVLAGVGVTFAPAVGYQFVSWDDSLYVLDNPAVVGPAGSVDPGERLLTPTLGYPAPVTVATYGVEHRIFGSSPGGYHATNVALHLAATLLLFFLALALGLRSVAAAAVAALFGLHPAVAEPVSWISGRKDLLAAVFSLAAAVAFLRDRERRGAREWVPVLLLLLGALSKPSALFLVPLLFAWDLLLRREGPGRAVVNALPLGVVGVVVFGVSLLGQRAVHAVRGAESVASILREAWYALGFHLGLVVGVQTPCVKHLPSSWPLRFEPAVDLLPVAAAAVVALGALALPRGDHRRLRTYGAALAWAGLSYLPSASLIPLTRYLADSYTYLPLAGLALAVGTVLDGLDVDRWRAPVRRVCLVLLGLALGLLGVSARRASRHWQDDVALWGHAHTRYPREYRICRNLGNAYVASSQPDIALELYESCAARTGREPFEKNIAIALFAMGRRDDARRAFLELAEKRPADVVVRKYLRLLGVDTPVQVAPVPSRDDE
jgi:hypothetical protein